MLIGQQTSLYFPADDVIIGMLVLQSAGFENTQIRDYSS